MSEPASVVRRDLLDVAFDDATTIARSHISRVELAPGRRAGVHRHPCHVVGCVLSGTIRFQVAGQPETLLGSGDAFHEPKDVEIPHFDNASAAEPAVFVACYLLPPGEERLIEML
jgi:quercetin dioxygenase-like cupin family protein